MNVADIDLLVGCAVLDPTWRALVVAVLSLVMAEIGKACAGAPVVEKGDCDERRALILRARAG